MILNKNDILKRAHTFVVCFEFLTTSNARYLLKIQERVVWSKEKIYFSCEMPILVFKAKKINKNVGW